MDKVFADQTLALGWAKVKSNAGACGGSPVHRPPLCPSAASVDGITIARFEKQAESRLLAVKEHLQGGDSRPQMIKRVWIDKPGSRKQRPLGFPTRCATAEEAEGREWGGRWTGRAGWCRVP